MTNIKSYWSTLKMFLNNRKIPCISLSSHQIEYVIDFKEKAEISNSFFAEQCTFDKLLEQTSHDVFKKDKKGYLINIV